MYEYVVGIFPGSIHTFGCDKKLSNAEIIETYCDLENDVNSVCFALLPGGKKKLTPKGIMATYKLEREETEKKGKTLIYLFFLLN